MFSLIITIVAIALVAILALATVYYGGSSFTEGSGKADAATIVNGGQQLEGAITFFKQDHNGQLPSSISDLTSNSKYLTGAPKGTWEFSDNYVTQVMTDESACKKANVMVGYATDESVAIPACSDSALLGRTVCCSE